MNMTKGKPTSVRVVATTVLLLALAASSATADLPRRALAQQRFNDDDGATPFPPCTAEDDGVIEYHARFHVEVKPAGLDLGYLSDALVSAATGLSKENIMMMPQSNMTNDDGGRGNGGRGGGRPGRGHRGLLMNAVDECSVEEAATAEGLRVEVHSADQAALLALKNYVESGEFEQEVVEGAACYAEVRARGGELEIKEVDPCAPPRRDDDDEGTHRRPNHRPRRDGQH